MRLSRQKNARVLLGTVLDIDPLSKHVLLTDGASFEYDWLIVAAGSHDSGGALLLESEWGQYRLPVEKCSAKPTAFGVVTNPNRIHSGVTFRCALGTVSPKARNTQ